MSGFTDCGTLPDDRRKRVAKFIARNTPLTHQGALRDLREGSEEHFRSMCRSRGVDFTWLDEQLSALYRQLKP